MKPVLQDLEVWLVTGSQHLYGPEVLDRIAENAGVIAACLGDSAAVPVRVSVRRPGEKAEDALPAGEVTVPALRVGLRSTLTATRRLSVPPPRRSPFTGGTSS